MKFGVIIFPGSNCDFDAYQMIRSVIKKEVEFLWHQDEDLRGSDCVILPGGFSYGDYLRTGAIARFAPIMKKVYQFAREGGLVIGICNGFQILLETGLLPGAMLRNTSLRFVCKYVYIRAEETDTPYSNVCQKYQVLKIPVAHTDGNYYISEKGLAKLKDNNQIIFRYCNPQGNIDAAFNPNGALYNIAGICNLKGNVLGMMPHPERCGEKILGSEDGRYVFESVVNYLKGRED